jgi:hypothetical protein
MAKEKQILIIAVMIFVLICMLFGLVVFGQMSSSHTYIPPPAYGYVTGTVFYHDGITPLVINDTNNGDYLYLYSSSNDFKQNIVTDANGYFSSVNVAPGTYYLGVYRNNYEIGHISPITVDNGQTLTENVTTSRTPTTTV